MAILRAMLLPLAVLLLGLAMVLSTPRAAHVLAIVGTILAGVEVVLVLLAA